MKRYLYLIGLLHIVAQSYAQQASTHLRKGNELYHQEKFNEAEIEYRKGIEKQPQSWTGNYNLANSLYKQEKYKEAELILDSLSVRTKDKGELASVYHNIGNAYLSGKEYEKSVEAYKKALKLNPQAEDSRYNLSYALKKLQRQQQQQQQQQSQSQQKEQQQKEQQRDQDQQKKPEEKKQNISRDDAERMLDALNRDENELRRRTDKKDGKGRPAEGGKDW